MLADFCFPNGVYAKRIDYDFTKKLEDQEMSIQN